MFFTILSNIGVVTVVLLLVLCVIWSVSKLVKLLFAVVVIVFSIAVAIEYNYLTMHEVMLVKDYLKSVINSWL